MTDAFSIPHRYCQFGKDHHRRLAAEFKKSKAKVMVVIGETPFIKELYGEEYIKKTYAKKYRFKLHSGRVDDKINTNHLIICNY